MSPPLMQFKVLLRFCFNFPELKSRLDFYLGRMSVKDSGRETSLHPAPGYLFFGSRKLGSRAWDVEQEG